MQLRLPFYVGTADLILTVAKQARLPTKLSLKLPSGIFLTVTWTKASYSHRHCVKGGWIRSQVLLSRAAVYLNGRQFRGAFLEIWISSQVLEQYGHPGFPRTMVQSLSQPRPNISLLRCYSRFQALLVVLASGSKTTWLHFMSRVQFEKTYRRPVRPLPRTCIQGVPFIESDPELSFFCPRKRRNKSVAFPISFPTLDERF